MTTLPASLKFTYEEYCAFPEDRKRHELIDGDHYVTPAPLTKHQRIVANLHRLVGHVIHEKELGLVLSAPIDVLLSNVDVVQPDFLFVSKARLSIITKANIQGAPDLVVEIFQRVHVKMMKELSGCCTSALRFKNIGSLIPSQSLSRHSNCK